MLEAAEVQARLEDHLPGSSLDWARALRSERFEAIGRGFSDVSAMSFHFCRLALDVEYCLKIDY